MKTVKHILRRLTTLLLAVMLLCTGMGVQTAFAEESAWPTGPEVDAPSAIIMDADTGTILYQKNMDEQHYPASVTKIMTTMLALKYCDLDEEVTFSADAVNKNEGDTSHIARNIGEKMTMEQCLYAVMLESANECAYAVAEHVGEKLGGDYQTFVDLMNKTAKSLGCTNTHFSNANGLPDETHVTTCHDMALISREAMKNETFRTITGTRSYKIPPTNKHDEITPLNNHHQMLSNYKGSSHLYQYCIGGKTGYTQAANYSLVTFAEKDDMTLICVVMDVETSEQQYDNTQTLFEYAFANFREYNISENETRLGTVNYETGSMLAEQEPFAKLDGSAKLVLPNEAEFNSTQTQINYDSQEENVAGTVVYTYDGVQVGTADVILTGAQVDSYAFTKYVDKVSNDDDDVSAAGESGGSDNTNGANSVVNLFHRLGNGLKSLRYNVINFVKNLNLKSFSLIEFVVLFAALALVVIIIVVIIMAVRRVLRRRKRRKESRDRRYKTITKNKNYSGKTHKKR